MIVTTFTAGAQNTLPLWIFGAIRLGQQLPEVNAVVVFVLALTIIPVAVSVRLTGGGGVTRSSVRATRICRPASRSTSARGPSMPALVVLHLHEHREDLQLL